MYRRAAREAIGGFPQISHSEDVYTGFEMAKVGYHLKYVPVNLSRGICPDDLDSYINQQYRWCEGSMEMVKDADFHTEPTLSLSQRISFWSGFTYYVSTAMTAFFAPIPAILMFNVLAVSPVCAGQQLPAVGGDPGALVRRLPLLMKSRWRPDVLRVQGIYSFTHAIAIYDVFFGRVAEWVPSGAAKIGVAPLATRVRLLAAGYIVVTPVRGGRHLPVANPDGYPDVPGVQPALDVALGPAGKRCRPIGRRTDADSEGIGRHDDAAEVHGGVGRRSGRTRPEHDDSLRDEQRHDELGQPYSVPPRR